MKSSNTNNREKTGSNERSHRLAKAMIGTIHFQNEIAYHVRVYMWGAIAVIMLLVFAEKITLDTALGSILIGGGAICIGLYLFVEARRSWLLGITDPELKKTAYAVMRNYIAAKEKQLQKPQIDPGLPEKGCQMRPYVKSGSHFQRPCG